MGMDRRLFLRIIGSGGVSMVAGCPEGVSGCPELKLDNEATYDTRYPDGGFHNENGIDMVVSEAGIADFVWDGLRESDEQWIRETDFEQAVVIGLREAAGGSNTSDFEFLGIEWEEDRVLHAYSCIEEIGGADIALKYSILLRVSYENQLPTNARYSHWEEGIKRTYETSE